MAPKLWSFPTLKVCTLYRFAGWYKARIYYFEFAAPYASHCRRDDKSRKNFASFCLLIRESRFKRRVARTRKTIWSHKDSRFRACRSFGHADQRFPQSMCAPFAPDVAVGRFPVLKYATRNWQLARKLTVTNEICIERVRRSRSENQTDEEKKLVLRFILKYQAIVRANLRLDKRQVKLYLVVS